MKKGLLGILIGLFLTFMVAFNIATYQANKSSAEVDQINGCFLFVNSKPVLPYDYLGTVELTKKDVRKTPGTGQYQHARDLLIKKIKEQFPQAEGIIFNFHDGGIDKADALKFK
ncbi:MAG: hypothetical protein IPK31_02100 [Chitinophagaceae bacterium]|nr:hypothetical protein [Chitinophagaceae bacterium]